MKKDYFYAYVEFLYFFFAYVENFYAGSHLKMICLRLFHIYACVETHRGIAPLSSYKTSDVPRRKKWGEMSLSERTMWIEEKRAWLTEKRRREQEYLDWRNADQKTDRAYRADASQELDMLEMLSELEEVEREEKVHE